MRTVFKRRGLTRKTGLALAMLIGSASGALCASSVGETQWILPDQTLSDGEAKKQGYVDRAFDFGVPELAFDTLVPADAGVETKPAPDDRGNETSAPELSVIGTIKVPPSQLPGAAETTITLSAFHLPYAASAARICDWDIANRNYRLSENAAGNGQATAESLGFRTRDGRKSEGAVAACFTRGDQVFVAEVAFNLSGAADERQSQALTDSALDLGAVFVSNLAWKDGKLPGFAADAIRTLDLPVEGDRFNVRIPTGFEIATNTFKRALPADLALTRKGEGQNRTLVFFSVQPIDDDTKDKDLDPAAVQDAFLQQVSDAQKPVLVSSGEDPRFKRAQISATSFRFTVLGTSGKDMGDIEATVVRQKKRLYIFGVWNTVRASSGRDAFFERLPGETAFDLLKIGILRGLTQQE